MKKTILPLLITLLLAAQTATVLADPVSDRISVTVKGDGPDVILIPGLACSTAVWDATVAHLGGHYRLHLVQVAGFAGSPAGANSEGEVIQPTVDAIDAYIRANQLIAPKVIGHSLGGLMALMLASEHPEDIGKVMIVDSLPFLGVLSGSSSVAAVKPGAAALRDQILGESPEAYAQGEKQMLPMMIKSPAGLEKVTAWAVASDKSVVARALYEDMTTDLRSKLPAMKTPVTLLYPWDAARGVPQATFDGLYQGSYAAVPHKTIVRIDGSYHFIMLDQPEKFAAQVDAFLK